MLAYVWRLVNGISPSSLSYMGEAAKLIVNSSYKDTPNLSSLTYRLSYQDRTDALPNYRQQRVIFIASAT